MLVLFFYILNCSNLHVYILTDGDDANSKYTQSAERLPHKAKTIFAAHSAHATIFLLEENFHHERFPSTLHRRSIDRKNGIDDGRVIVNWIVMMMPAV